jgi:hypothetical protein
VQESLDRWGLAGTALVKAGFTGIMPWAAPAMTAIPELSVGEKLPLKDVQLQQVCLLVVLWVIVTLRCFPDQFTS